MLKRISLLTIHLMLALFLLTPIPGLAQICIPQASFVADVTVPDDTLMAPGQSFEKVWRLRNSGACDWRIGYGLVFLQGDLMGAPVGHDITSPVAPGQTVDFAVNMTAPQTPGTYTSFWQMTDTEGQNFGPIYFVRIIVPGAAPIPAPAQVPVVIPVQPAQDWEIFSTDRVDISLPASYEGGRPDSQPFQLAMDRVRQMGPQYNQLVDLMQQNASDFVFMAFDMSAINSGFVTNVNIIAGKTPPMLTLSQTMDILAQQFVLLNRRIIGKEMIALPPYEAGRLIMETTELGISYKQVMYLVKDGDNLWAVTFSVQADQLDQRMVEFERSIGTFRPKY